MTRLLRRDDTPDRADAPADDLTDTPADTPADASAEDGERPGGARATGEAEEDGTPGAPETAGETEAPGDDGEGDGEGDGTGGRRRAAAGWRKAVLPAAVTLLLLGGGGFFHGAHQLRSVPSARNHALTDTAATHRVGGDVSEGLARIFSYTPTSSDATERSAGTVLAGRAARQYADLFAQVRAGLAEQRLSLSTQAVRTGVIELDGDRARLLVFLDQVSRRDRGPATSAAAQLTVTARFQDDRWRIVDIKAR
ncbi:hypothetical protein AB0E83_26180 [Streptomyces sp. NPDC035033]|uniref:hypothetical protein n=1 Tax=Streptomyces sp. NPDC035033 TaxID=3155368 RepID=UPI0033FC5D10